MSSTPLFFNYSSTAKIRIKKANCYESPDYPCLYGIITKKLCFTIPRAAVIMTKAHVYIPNEIYRQELVKYYNQIKPN
jgi:hypothetical protein